MFLPKTILVSVSLIAVSALVLLLAACGPTPEPQVVVGVVKTEIVKVVETEFVAAVEAGIDIPVATPEPETTKAAVEEIAGEPESKLLCDPDSPSSESYLPLTDDDRRPEDVDNPYLVGGPAQAIDYVNELGQTFRITVSGKSESAIADYFDKARVCFHAVEVGEPDDEGWGTYSPYGRLIQATLALTGLSRHDLFDVKGGYPLADIIIDNGGDVTQVRDTAIVSATDDLWAAYEAGAMMESEVSNYLDNLEIDLDQTLEQEDFPILFLFADALEEETTSTGEILLGPEGPEGEGHLVIDMEWLDASELDNPEHYRVDFTIDPTVGGDQYHHYPSKCRPSAWARVSASLGEVTLTAWRFSPPKWKRVSMGNATAKKDGPPSKWLGHKTPNRKSSTYDINVYGYRRYPVNTYTISGSWRNNEANNMGGQTCPR